MSKRTPSPAQIAASRGSLSQESRARSARNSLKHGLAANTIADARREILSGLPATPALACFEEMGPAFWAASPTAVAALSRAASMAHSRAAGQNRAPSPGSTPQLAENTHQETEIHFVKNEPEPGPHHVDL